MDVNTIRIAPSILSADFAALGSATNQLEEWGADMVHIDVMDGNFVSNITFGASMVKALRPHSKLPFDVHLMVENPLKWIPIFKDAGADIFTFHIEADRHSHRTIQTVKKLNMKAGIALNPATPLSILEYILDDIDLVLLMTVNPGAPAQEFIPSVVEKIKRLNDVILERDLRVDIEIDGGINASTARHCIDAGADILVAGNSIFTAPNPISMIKKLRGEDDYS